MRECLHEQVSLFLVLGRNGAGISSMRLTATVRESFFQSPPKDSPSCVKSVLSLAAVGEEAGSREP